jgi:hypothetical protein
MNFSNRLKGAITQVLLKTLLEDSGYRIVPLGIEEVIRELAVIDEERYKALFLPGILRKLPDFFVSDEDLMNSWLVEVKYRRRWNDNTRDLLARQISSQVNDWNPLYLMVFLGEPGKPDQSLPSSWMGILRLISLDGDVYAANVEGSPFKRFADIQWTNFYRIQDVFRDLSKKAQWEQQTLTRVKTILRQLRSLDMYD